MNEPLIDSVAGKVARQFVPESEAATLLSFGQVKHIIKKAIEIYELEKGHAE